jgi:hypothetical protein
MIEGSQTMEADGVRPSVACIAFSIAGLGASVVRFLNQV